MTATPRGPYRVSFTSRAERQPRRVGDAELSVIVTEVLRREKDTYGRR